MHGGDGAPPLECLHLLEDFWFEGSKTNDEGKRPFVCLIRADGLKKPSLVLKRPTDGLGMPESLTGIF